MNSQRAFHDRFTHLFDRGTAFVVVTIVDAQGSVPQDAGNKMIVVADGLDWGTVGGGRLEAKALDEALRMLAEQRPSTAYVDWSLKADVGMTCGGRIKLYFETFHRQPWTIAIFGAGHVAQAVARLLVGLPCRTLCIDPRADWLSKLPAEVQTVETDQPATWVARLPSDSYVLCMTRGHQSDLPVLKQIFSLERPFPYLGVIGSRAKAAVLRKELLESGIEDSKIVFQCPVGLDLGSNHPGEIAISIAAQLLQVRDRLQEASMRSAGT